MEESLRFLLTFSMSCFLPIANQRFYLHFLSRNPTFRSTNNAQRGHSKRFSQKMARSVVMEAIQTLGAIQVRRGGRENVRRNVELRGAVPTRHTRSHLHLLLVLNLQKNQISTVIITRGKSLDANPP